MSEYNPSNNNHPIRARMKRFVTVVLMAILLAACEGRKEMADGLERIPVNVEDVVPGDLVELAI